MCTPPKSFTFLKIACASYLLFYNNSLTNSYKKIFILNFIKIILLIKFFMF